MITNASLDENDCRKIADRVGFIRKTHYGEEYFIRHRDNTNNLAYRSEPLQMHTDLPYYEYTPGVNLLHCIVQTNSAGAFNLLTDAFMLAERLRHEYPNLFKILTETPVDWSDYGEEDGNRFAKIYRLPIIRFVFSTLFNCLTKSRNLFSSSLDAEGNIQRITNSIPQRDSHFTIDAEKVEEWYTAMFKFMELCREEAVSFKTKPGEFSYGLRTIAIMFRIVLLTIFSGDILAFSNTRILHGRTGYVDQNGNTRHLVGAFVDWDEVYSRLRTLTNS